MNKSKLEIARILALNYWATTLFARGCVFYGYNGNILDGKCKKWNWW